MGANDTALTDGYWHVKSGRKVRCDKQSELVRKEKDKLRKRAERQAARFVTLVVTTRSADWWIAG